MIFKRPQNMVLKHIFTFVPPNMLQKSQWEEILAALAEQ